MRSMTGSDIVALLTDTAWRPALYNEAPAGFPSPRDFWIGICNPRGGERVLMHALPDRVEIRKGDWRSPEWAIVLSSEPDTRAMGAEA